MNHNCATGAENTELSPDSEKARKKPQTPVCVLYLYGVGLGVTVGLWQTPVGVSVAEAAAHHPHLLQGVKVTESSAWQPWDIAQLRQPHPEAGEP